MGPAPTAKGSQVSGPEIQATREDVRHLLTRACEPTLRQLERPRQRRVADFFVALDHTRDPLQKKTGALGGGGNWRLHRPYGPNGGKQAKRGWWQLAAAQAAAQAVGPQRRQTRQAGVVPRGGAAERLAASTAEAAEAAACGQPAWAPVAAAAAGQPARAASAAAAAGHTARAASAAEAAGHTARAAVAAVVAAGHTARAAVWEAAGHTARAAVEPVPAGPAVPAERPARAAVASA